jgi:hypothetical protein
MFQMTGFGGWGFLAMPAVRPPGRYPVDEATAVLMVLLEQGPGPRDQVELAALYRDVVSLGPS